MGVDGDQERSAEPIEAVDEDRGELALFGVLEDMRIRVRCEKANPSRGGGAKPRGLLPN